MKGEYRMLDIVQVRTALDTLEPLLSKVEYHRLRQDVGAGIISFHEDKSEERYRADLLALGIDMKLDVDISDYEDAPF